MTASCVCARNISQAWCHDTPRSVTILYSTVGALVVGSVLITCGRGGHLSCSNP